MGYKYSNRHGISLPLAVWLMYDDYDYDSRENTISATTLLKPTRSIVLALQNKDLDKHVDITDLVSSRMGSAIHSLAEHAWTDRDNLTKALTALGVSGLDEKFVINPESYTDDEIPVFIEQRHEKEVDDFIITGKYDLVLDGEISDYKSTSTWTYIYDSNAEKYAQQGSIYKWLAPEVITKDNINIQYIFTDWSSAQARRDPKYPQSRVLTKAYPLWSQEKTDQFITDKVIQIKTLLDKPQAELPLCTSDELWESDTKYKYFKNPNASRATKVFSTFEEATQRQADDGNVGIVKTIPGEVKACRYCNVVDICDQSKNLIQQGRLVL